MLLGLFTIGINGKMSGGLDTSASNCMDKGVFMINHLLKPYTILQDDTVGNMKLWNHDKKLFVWGFSQKLRRAKVKRCQHDTN